MTAEYLPHACLEMRKFIHDDRVPIVYEPRFCEYSLVLANSSAYQLIRFCPWCAVELPASLRHRFYDELEIIGVDYPNEAPPTPYQSDAWWRAGGVTSAREPE